MPRASVTINAVLVGAPKPLGRGELSCIAKEPITGAMMADADGLVGDQQADRRVHGGPDKALLFYSSDHYTDWQSALPDRTALLKPGGFGENLSAHGLCEDAVVIGDRWRAGGALLQVCQGRQPCWKLNARFDIPDMLDRVLANGKGGWYCRVLEPGLIAAGDAMTLVDRPDHGWTVARVTRIMLGKEKNRDLLAAVAALPDLAEGWRSRAAARS